MNREDLRLTPEEANAPRPSTPERGDPRLWRWIYYWEDLACWKATQAEKYLSGIKE